MNRVQIKGQTVLCEHVNYFPPLLPVNIAAKGDTFRPMSYRDALTYVKSHRIGKQELANAVAALNTLIPERQHYSLVDRWGNVYVYGPLFRSIHGDTKTVFAHLCHRISVRLS